MNIQEISNKLNHNDQHILNKIVEILPELKAIKNLKKTWLIFPMLHGVKNFSDFSYIIHFIENGSTYNTFEITRRGIDLLKTAALANAKILTGKKQTKKEVSRLKRLCFSDLYTYCDDTKIQNKVYSFRDVICEYLEKEETKQ